VTRNRPPADQESQASGPAIEPLVSVVIPCFNQAHFLDEALQSVAAQTYGRIETIVVDDGSTDNTSQVTRRYPRVIYRHQSNRGAAAARNAGIAASNGEFLVFLDADDRLLSWAVETGMQAFEADRGIACAVGACRDIGPAAEELGTPGQVLVHRDHYLALLRSCFVLSGSSVLFSRWCLEAVGGFDESYLAGDDYDLYLRIARRFPIECHGRVVTDYRRHAASLTQDPILTMRGELSALRAQRRAVRNREERAALRAGRQRAQRAHGASLRNRLFEQAQHRDWEGVFKSARTLARRHPSALANAAGDLWVARRSRHHRRAGSDGA
jgi:cellulose synthase/poly-beta-1,6-N-acetylglucosamine synthase-like glycosyltransferase